MSVLGTVASYTVTAYKYVVSLFFQASSAGAEIDRNYESTIDTKLREIPGTPVDPVNDFLTFARIHLSSRADIAKPSSKDPSAHLFRPLIKNLQREAERIGAYTQIPEGQWLNLTDVPLLDAIHNARLEARRFIRRRFAPEGWTPDDPMTREFVIATPKSQYIASGLYLCELILRKGYRLPFADAPEAEEYD